MKSKSGFKKSILAVFLICLAVFIGYSSHKKDMPKEYGDLYGYVKEISGETVSVDKLIVIKNDNGDTSKPAQKVEKFKITKDTDIILRNTYNSGNESKDSKGTINNIKTKGIVIVWGESKEDVIIAKKVVVFKHN
ncbi:hypothetical protein RBU49_12270 [Clostridium sp. MB40-C1]|uniref:hypothetical protein n=1 Tax=Clostridium sp. MB40-C1 TaxID=3070996 RepID=UPI0027E1B749|nr:hypothetical protein [Clostridium sp. MB40-C1]WMJ79643.1 hypothetical protein RBU49_12270 [Clostridium sp. MB40-C1]